MRFILIISMLCVCHFAFAGKNKTDKASPGDSLEDSQKFECDDFADLYHLACGTSDGSAEINDDLKHEENLAKTDPSFLDTGLLTEDYDGKFSVLELPSALFASALTGAQPAAAMLAGGEASHEMLNTPAMLGDTSTEAEIAKSQKIVTADEEMSHKELKRKEKNRLSAIRSRKKKQKHYEFLTQTIAHHESTISEQRRKIAELEEQLAHQSCASCARKHESASH